MRRSRQDARVLWHTSPTASTEARLRDLVASLTLTEKVALCSGAGTWHTTAIPRIDLDAIAVSDGPAGIRGTATDLAEVRIASDEELSISFPAPSALAATWDVGLAERFGQALASEAVREGVDVVLAPVVNLQRTPVGGRHFECFSEDPLLTGRLATAIVEGIQGCGVAACVKHFVGNEAETRRTTAISRIDERTLREVYLAPFEAAIQDAGAWSVMAAYNRVDVHGVAEKAVGHPWLLDELLRREWGFDGVVMSDWSAATDTVSTGRHGLDLVMPGPDTVWSAGRLEEAVAHGMVSEAAVDAKVLNLLRLAARVGALDGNRTRRRTAVSRDGARALSRRIAACSFVVLRHELNDLPIGDPPRTVALIGPNAVAPYLQGGGSASIPLRQVESIEQALGRRWPGVDVTVSPGAYARVNPSMLTATALRDPETGTSGVRVDYLDDGGAQVASALSADWSGVVRALPTDIADVRVRTVVRLEEPGWHWLGAAVVGRHRVSIDGIEVSRSEDRVGEEAVLDSSANNPAAAGHAIHVDVPRDVLIDVTAQNVDAGGLGVFARAGLHHRVPGPSADALIAEAVEHAVTSDLVVVVIGTNEDIESEGWDRPDLALPGAQNRLVDAVLAVRPDAVVVVNAGAPVELPWLHRASTVLWAWLPGQEFAGALTDVLAGDAEPSGRLPWTLPVRHDDVPVRDGIPDAGDVVDYLDGLDVGYRGWLRSGVQPMLPFGFGLGWTTWRYSDASAGPWSANGIEVGCTVENIGARSGREVVQVYVEASTGEPRRPRRWLGGFGIAEVSAGERRNITVRIPRRAFEVWDTDQGAWRLPAGEYQLLIGRDVSDIRNRIAARIDDEFGDDVELFDFEGRQTRSAQLTNGGPK
ncbi:glycoside hydrolase family 3 protein [Agromyces sp. ISL-38]|uniref:beta-glucosidase family protein n=1 Tax=Agromyces sp. ISL-38 TaxID=2819107 RepID=UPI001BED2190|nr:glycoside hydrolase family 3 N-terminal domain-containing protein [Agromyces sp. ISL-38]MBT2498603.1 glycoside hydrolase family 3 protein [Agromyces sp. ISL-38]